MAKRKKEGTKNLPNERAEPEQTSELKKSKGAILDVLVKFASLFTIIVGVISYLLHYLFEINAERFYGVPSLYFSDRKLDFGLVIICMLIPSTIYFISYYIKTISKKNEFTILERRIFAFVVALLILLESLIFSSYLINLVLLYTCLPSLFSRVFCICLSIAFSMYSFCRYYDFFGSDSEKHSKVETRNCISTGILTKLRVDPQTQIHYPQVLAVILVITMSITLLLKATPLDVKNQRGYEFISRKESGYRIVVEHYEDSVVLMQGSDTEYKKNRYRLTINKGDYRIEPLGERQIEYRQFDKVGVKPKVESKDEE